MAELLKPAMYDESNCYWMHWSKAQTPRQGASSVWVILWNWSYTIL